MDDPKPFDEVSPNATTDIGEPRTPSTHAPASATPASRPVVPPQDHADPCRNRLRLTIPEAAKWLGISKSQMYEIRQKPGGPPVHKHGRLAFIDCKELLLWYEGKLPDWKSAARNGRHRKEKLGRRRPKTGWRWRRGKDVRSRTTTSDERDGD